MNRLHIRTRLTLAFTAALAVVFLLAGTFLYLRLEHSLDASIDASLQAQSGQVAALVRQADSGLRQGGNTAARSDSFAQILTSTGGVFDASPQLGTGPLLSATQLQDAFQHPRTIDRTVDRTGPLRGGASVNKRTPRLAWVAGGICQARAASRGASIRPPVRIGAPSSPVPYSPVLEKAWLRDADDIVQAVRGLVNS